jgi:hypothetical protein
MSDGCADATAGPTAQYWGRESRTAAPLNAQSDGANEQQFSLKPETQLLPPEAVGLGLLRCWFQGPEYYWVAVSGRGGSVRARMSQMRASSRVRSHKSAAAMAATRRSFGYATRLCPARLVRCGLSSGWQYPFCPLRAPRPAYRAPAAPGVGRGHEGGTLPLGVLCHLGPRRQRSDQARSRSQARVLASAPLLGYRQDH